MPPTAPPACPAAVLGWWDGPWPAHPRGDMPWGFPMAAGLMQQLWVLSPSVNIIQMKPRSFLNFVELSAPVSGSHGAPAEDPL